MRAEASGWARARFVAKQRGRALDLYRKSPIFQYYCEETIRRLVKRPHYATINRSYGFECAWLPVWRRRRASRICPTVWRRTP